MADGKCGKCKYYGGLNMNVLPVYGLYGPPLGGYWCWAMRRYMVDTKEECNFFDALVPEGTTCTHPKMDECHPGCGHFYCPDCGLTWDDGAEK